MKIVLNRDIKGLGKVGDVVVVRDGYGRNFLLPKGYAVVATKANLERLQSKIEDLKKQNEILFQTANELKEILDKNVFNIVRQAADDDTIYGSVRTKDVYNFICDLIKKNNLKFNLDIGAVKISEPLKALGQYIINIELFSGVDGIVRLNICRAITDFEDDVVEFDKKKEKAFTDISKKNNSKKSEDDTDMKNNNTKDIKDKINNENTTKNDAK